MAKSAVTPERFAKGRTFDEYVAYVGSAENLAREAFGSYFPDGGAKPRPAQGQQRGVPRALRAGAPRATTRPPPSSGSRPSPAAPRRSW